MQLIHGRVLRARKQRNVAILRTLPEKEKSEVYTDRNYKMGDLFKGVNLAKEPHTWSKKL